MKLSSHFGDFRIFIAWKCFPGAALSRYPWAENFKIFVEAFLEQTWSWSFFWGGKGYTPQAKLKLQVRPLKSYKKGPKIGKYSVCSFWWFLRHQRNAQTPTVETWNIPWDFLEIRLQIDLFSCDACADALPVQSRFNEESRLQKEFQTCHGTSKVYHKVGPYYCWWIRKILHQLIGWLSHYFQGFFTSCVVREFFHQQYSCKRSWNPTYIW